VWETAVTSTIYDSVASSKGFKPCFVYSRQRLSTNSSAKIPEVTTSWCSISRAVQTNAVVDHGGFPLRAAMNLSRSSLCTPAVRYTVSWPLSTSMWIDSHPIACCFLFSLFPVSHTISKWVSWVIFSVATIAVSRYTNWCLRRCCVSPGGALCEAPVVWLDLASITPG